MRNLSSNQEINQFSSEQRRRILREESTFFTFATDGKNIFEFHEVDGSFEKNISYYDEERSRINERFKQLVDIGNNPSDTFIQFLKEGKSYEAVVIGVDDLKRTIVAQLAGVRVIIPESGFEWAHERKFGENPMYFPAMRTPSKILKKGDVILVELKEKNIGLDQLINVDFFKKYKDPALRALISKQKFIKASLDQEPEVEGALVALNANTGEVLTMVGGVDFKKSQFNRAIQSARQPGSSFKPFIYAAALENGFTPSSILMDTPQALGGVDNSLSWKPRNYDGDFKGPMTLRNALEVSRNIPTVRLVQSLGVDKIHSFVERFHIQTELPKDMSLSLGSFGISLTELTKAYAVFPNGGKAIRIKNITSIKDRTGKSYSIPAADQPWPVEAAPKEEEGEAANPVVNANPFLNNLNQTQVYDERLAYVMTNLLRGVVLHGTATAAASLSPNLGGKTGTTNNYVDALFLGFSHNIVVGSWTGFDDNRPLGYGETGAKAALPAWIDFMGLALGKYGAADFKMPEGVSQILVNKETGKPLPAGSQTGFSETFVNGFDLNSSPLSFEQDSQNNKAPTMDDDDYFMNQ